MVLIFTDLHAPDQTLLHWLRFPLPKGVHVILERRVPFLPNVLHLPRRPIPNPLHTLQPVLDNLPEAAREALLALSVLGEAQRALLLEMAHEKGLERLMEGLLLSEEPLRLFPELAEAGKKEAPRRDQASLAPEGGGSLSIRVELSRYAKPLSGSPFGAGSARPGRPPSGGSR